MSLKEKCKAIVKHFRFKRNVEAAKQKELIIEKKKKLNEKKKSYEGSMSVADGNPGIQEDNEDENEQDKMDGVLLDEQFS